MRKIFYLTIVIFWLGIISISAQNPIPSYNVPVYNHANFQEQNKSFNANLLNRGKRAVNVKVVGGISSMATIYIYSLDYQNILGPFIVNGGETLTIDIDSREWGVLVNSEDHVTVDVWIDEGS